jgi:hypothetical protein
MVGKTEHRRAIVGGPEKISPQCPERMGSFVVWSYVCNEPREEGMMSTLSTSEYLLLFRGTDWHKGLSPEQIQTVVNDMKAWFDRLTEQGKLKAGKPLMPEGKIVSQKKGRVVADGPFAESKEAVAGFFLLEVSSIDEAAEIAKDFPGLNYGALVEVRTVAPECSLAQVVGEKIAEQRASA